MRLSTAAVAAGAAGCAFAGTTSVTSTSCYATMNNSFCHRMTPQTGRRASSVSLITMMAKAGSGRKGKKKMSALQAEKELYKRGYKHVIGSDEAGRGALAGPVIAASCCIITENINTFQPIQGVDDSKALTMIDRERIYRHVMSRPELYAVHVSEVSSNEIDGTNVLVATMKCFRQTIEGIVAEKGFLPEETYSIVDGKKSPKLANCPGLSCRPYVKADTEVYSVAIASIVAKTIRDELMATTMHDKYPQYDFAGNKGYNSPDHLVAIHTQGACPIHRMSFAALKDRKMNVR